MPAGTLAFTIQPAAQGGDSVACLQDTALAVPCGIVGSSGELSYQALEAGLHRFTVELRDATDRAVSTAEHVLEVVAPTVVVVGATPGGIAAAVAAAEEGQPVALLEPTRWLGGMMSGGLTATDIGVRGEEVVGGLGARFFERVRAAAAAKGICPDPCDRFYGFESKQAEIEFERMLDEAGVVVEREIEVVGVTKRDATLEAVETSRGDLPGRIFVDASYEGDLMKLADVPYRLGREPRLIAPPGDAAQLALQEDNAGVRRYRLPRGVHVDPYRVHGDPASGTLPFVEPRPPELPRVGDGDARVMAYTYRLCVTDDPSNRIPFERPAKYDPREYEASARLVEAWVAQAGVDPAEVMFNPAPTVMSATPGHFKHDLNGGSTFSIDMTAPWLNQAYPEADASGRARIRRQYRDYIEGLLYFWQTDPRFGRLNEKVARFGRCLDEFTDRGGWPHQLYVRNARRMVGEYTMNENDVMRNGRRAPIADAIAMGAYNIDVHTVRYKAAPVSWPDGTRRDALVLEGFLTLRQPEDRPYPISYRALTPRAADATNLLNPVTLSSTHIAYAALRMEPTFIALGEAAGVAAALALEQNQTVQTVDYFSLRERLLGRGQVLSD